MFCPIEIDPKVPPKKVVYSTASYEVPPSGTLFHTRSGPAHLWTYSNCCRVFYIQVEHAVLVLNRCAVWLDHYNAQISWKYGTARAGLNVAYKKCEFCMFFFCTKWLSDHHHRSDILFINNLSFQWGQKWELTNSLLDIMVYVALRDLLVHPLEPFCASILQLSMLFLYNDIKFPFISLSCQEFSFNEGKAAGLRHFLQKPVVCVALGHYVDIKLGVIKYYLKSYFTRWYYFILWTGHNKTISSHKTFNHVWQLNKMGPASPRDKTVVQVGKST